MRFKLRIIFILVFLVCLVSCAKKTGQREYEDFDKIPKQEFGKRQEKFSSYPVDKQIDIYLYAQFGFEGGHDLTGYLKDNGEQKIPEILRRIEIGNFMHKSALIHVLYYIDKDCACISQNSEIMDSLSSQMQKEADIYEGFKVLYKESVERLNAVNHDE